MSYYGISLKGNAEQQELARLISTKDKKIIFCTGNAGTGKTFVTLATALQLKGEKRYEKIVYARNPVQLGEEIGFLPGDIAEKYNPFMGGLLDNLQSIANKSSMSPNLSHMKMQIEITPIAFLRGRSFENTILIIDEAQNLDLVALKAVLTRIDEHSKIILLGSMNQIDDKRQARKNKCDFQQVIEKLQDQPYAATIELVQSMRSKICVEIDALLGEIKE